MVLEGEKTSVDRKVFLRLFLFVALLSGLGSAAMAQVTASIRGTVTDASGAAVAG